MAPQTNTIDHSVASRSSLFRLTLPETGKRVELLYDAYKPLVVDQRKGVITQPRHQCGLNAQCADRCNPM